MFSLPQIEKNVVDTVYFEIDAPTIELANRSADIMEKALRERGFEWRKYFSGRRGFHYYLDHGPVTLKNPGIAMFKFIQTLPDVVDPNCIGRMRQLARIPYTKHPKTGLMSFRVYDSFTFADALRPVPREDGPVDNPSLPDILLSFDEEVVERRKNQHLAPTTVKLEYWPPCIIHALEELNTSQWIPHPKRLQLASFLLKVGWDVENVIDAFRVAKDFTDKYTRYQVEKLSQREANCFGCRKAAVEGICPTSVRRGEEECGFFPSINQYLLGEDNEL